MHKERVHVYAYEESHFLVFKARNADTGENLIGTSSLDQLRVLIDKRDAIIEVLDARGLEEYTHGIWDYSNGLGVRPLSDEERAQLKL